MIKKFSLEEADKVYNLISAVFNEYVGVDYSEEGNRTFNDFIRPDQIIERYKSGNIVLTYQIDGEIIGMIEVRDDNHICLFFVHSDYHGRGIGRMLFNEILRTVKGKTDIIDVNASPFSEEIYSRLGFSRISDTTEKNGIIYIPMKMEL
jgi:GNAT superfamily N-acetyltransferase